MATAIIWPIVDNSNSYYFKNKKGCKKKITLMDYNSSTGKIFPYNPEKYKKKPDEITNKFYTGFFKNKYPKNNFLKKKSKYLSSEDLNDFQYSDSEEDYYQNEYLSDDLNDEYTDEYTDEYIMNKYYDDDDDENLEYDDNYVENYQY